MTQFNFSCQLGSACTFTSTATVPANGTSGTPVTFLANITSNTCSPPSSFTYEWNFGDGTSHTITYGGVSSTTTHTYETAGSWPWSVTIRYPGAETQVKSGSIAISGALTPVSIVTHPQSQSISYGSTATLSVVTAGSPPISYQWYEGAAGVTTNPVGANSSGYTTPALYNNASYWVRASNTIPSSADSNVAVISVCQINVVLPTSLSVPLSLPFTITPTTLTVPVGTTYQWYSGTDANNVNTVVPGATSSTLTVTAPSSPAVVYYKIKAMHVDCQDFISNVCMVAEGAPVITNLTFESDCDVAGAKAFWWFSVNGGNPGTVGYDMYIKLYWNGTQIGPQDVDGYRVIHIPPTPNYDPDHPDSYVLSYIDICACGSTPMSDSKYLIELIAKDPVPTASAMVSRKDCIQSYSLDCLGGLPYTCPGGSGTLGVEAYSVPASGSTITKGSSVNFYATASGGTPPYTYAWDFSWDGVTWNPTSTEQNPVKTYNTSRPNHPYQIKVKARDSVGNVKSFSDLFITVKDQCVIAGCTASVATQSYVGTSVSFNATMTDGTPACSGTPTFTWDFGDGTSGSGLNTTHTYEDSGNYTWTFTAQYPESLPCTKSGTISISACSNAVITAHPQNVVLPLSGGTATLSVTATGTLPLYYQWYEGGFADTSNPISGAVAATYQVPWPWSPPAVSRSFWVAVSNNCGEYYIMSNVATVSTCDVSIVTQPQSYEVTSGDSVTLSVVAGGTGPFTYQWYKGADESDPVVGGTSSSLLVQNITVAATYWVKVSSACGSINSNIVSITISPSTAEECTGLPSGPATISIYGRATWSTYPPGCFPAGENLDLIMRRMMGTFDNSAFTGNGTKTVTVDTISAHGLATGDLVTITGTGVPRLNVNNWPIVVTGSTTFTYTYTGANSYSDSTYGTVEGFKQCSGFTTVGPDGRECTGWKSYSVAYGVYKFKITEGTWSPEITLSAGTPCKRVTYSVDYDETLCAPSGAGSITYDPCP